ncbi:hypothetical protein Tco_0825342, partial [Tanacetum coccineum]
EEQAFLDELERLKRQEKEANEEAEALRKEFAQETKNLVIQAGAAKASSTNLVNTVSIPDIYQNSSDGIFTTSSYDDKGAVADFTNLETVVTVSPIPTSRIYSSHPSALILGDPTSAIQTRSKVNKSSGAHAFVSYVQKQRRNPRRFQKHLKMKICLLGRRLLAQSRFIEIRRMKEELLSEIKQGLNISHVKSPLCLRYVSTTNRGEECITSERPSEAQPTPSPAPTSEVPIEPPTDSSPAPTSEVTIEPPTDSSPAHTSEVPIEQQTDPSPRPSPSTIIPDSIPETSDQAKEIQHLKAHIKKLKKQAKPVIKHHRAWMQSISLKQRLARKRSSKTQWVLEDHTDEGSATKLLNTLNIGDEQQYLRKFLAQQRSEAIRNRPPTKNQLRNQMMTYLKHVGNFKHSELKTKKLEEIQALYEKIKRSDEDFISIGSAEDERLIKRMNEKGIDSSKNEMVKEESKEEVKEENKEEESTRKRKLGTRKKMKSRKRRFIQNTSEDDSEKENDELRLHLTIAPDEEKEKVLLKMLELKLESEEDSTMALELIRFVKKLVAELEPEDSNGDEEDL